jgi:hypothetical protein
MQIKKMVKTCCCFDKGECELSCYFEKNAYYPDEVARVVANLDNSKCNSEVKHVSIKAVRVIKAKAGIHNHSETTKLAGTRYDGLKAHESVQRRLEIKLSDIQKANAFKLDKYKDKKLYH